MKKSISILLVIFILATLALTSCGSSSGGEAKFGVGVHTAYEENDASASSAGKGGAVYTVASTLVDKNGKIIKCIIDVMDARSEVTAEGELKIPDEFKTKRELGDSYVMSTDENKLKWYEQADAFAKLAEGKTLSGVRSMVTGDGTGNGKVISAGCTITVSEFVLAIEKSMQNAEKIDLASYKDINEIDLKISTKATGNNAAANVNGKIEFETAVDATLKFGDSAMKDKNIKKDIKDTLSFDKDGKFIK